MRDVFLPTTCHCSMLIFGGLTIRCGRPPPSYCFIAMGTLGTPTFSTFELVKKNKKRNTQRNMVIESLIWLIWEVYQLCPSFNFLKHSALKLTNGWSNQEHMFSSSQIKLAIEVLIVNCSIVFRDFQHIFKDETSQVKVPGWTFEIFSHSVWL